MTGPQIEYHYLRDTETGERTPVAYRVPPSQDWIPDEGTMCADLFARDAAYAKVQAALGPMFPSADGEPQGAARIDNDEVVNLLLPADQQSERWLSVAVSLVEAAPDEVSGGRVTVEWVA
jgi:hypothetical protein